MDESPYEKRLNLLRKKVEQGARLETLNNNEDFQWFLGWVTALRDGLEKRILRGDLLALNTRLEDHAKGGYKYLSDVLDYAETLPKEAAKARKKLDEYLKAEENQRERPTEE